jgi:hypothetical protein
MSHAWERGGRCTGFCWENPKERDHSEERDIGGRIDQNGS